MKKKSSDPFQVQYLKRQQFWQCSDFYADLITPLYYASIQKCGKLPSFYQNFLLTYRNYLLKILQNIFNKILDLF